MADAERDDDADDGTARVDDGEPTGGDDRGSAAAAVHESTDPSDRALLVAAGILAYVVAAVHLFHPSIGFGRFLLLVSVDPGLLVSDPRPLGFVLVGFAILVAVPAVVRGLPRRPVAVAGAATMVLLVVGYTGWHLSGHGGFLPNREPLYHGLTPLEALVGHLTSDGYAAVALIAEVALLAVLVALLARDRRRG